MWFILEESLENSGLKLNEDIQRTPNDKRKVMCKTILIVSSDEKENISTSGDNGKYCGGKKQSSANIKLEIMTESRFWSRT